MARKKGDVMIEITPTVSFYHILKGDPSSSGFVSTTGITIGKDGQLMVVNAESCINVNEPRAGVVTIWLEPEVIDPEFKEVEPIPAFQRLEEAAPEVVAVGEHNPLPPPTRVSGWVESAPAEPEAAAPVQELDMPAVAPAPTQPLSLEEAEAAADNGISF